MILSRPSSQPLPRYLPRSSLLWLLALLGMASTGAMAATSNKWRVEFDNKAQSSGSIILRVAPVGLTPTDVKTDVPEGIHENHIAGLVRDALKARLGEAYDVEVDDGEDVLLKKQGDTPDFELSLVSSSVLGLEVQLERE